MVSLFANEIDERKTDIYFGNGVWNSYDDAVKGQEKLQKNIDSLIINDNQQLKDKYGKVKLVYNWTGTSPGNSVAITTKIYDLIETFYQLKKEGQFQNSDIYTFIRAFMLSKAPITLPLIDSILQEYVSSITADNLKVMLDKYNDESFDKSHRVLLIAHSQGNLFGNSIYDALGWKQDYFKMVSIATPSKRVTDGKLPYTTFECDDIINLYDFSSDGIPGHLPGKMPCTEYEVSGDGHQLIPFYLVNVDSVSEIMQNVENQLQSLETKPSQWNLKNENTETTICEERRAELVHFKNALSSIPVAYPFNEDGKVYQVPDTNGSASYVIGSADGTKILDVQSDTDNRCYELENTTDVISIENTCGDLNTTDGIITVDLLWTKKELDLDLTIEGPTEGEYLNKDKGCPREYFFIQDESSLKTGTYKVKVSVKGNVDDSMVPENVSVLIKANKQKDTLVIPVEDIRTFDMGYVAEIKVTENKTTTTTVSKTTSSGTPIVSGTSTTSTSTNTVYPDYIYEIIRLINQIYFGPVRDAHLEFYSVSDYAKKLSPLFVGATSGGYDLHTAGLVFIPFSVVDQLSDNELYLLSAQGGEDIDADDDGKVDAAPASNNGTLHGVLSGKMIKDGAYKVNILTELAYQVTKDMFDVNTSEVILDRMNKIAQRLITKDVNGDKVINSKDLTKWLPTTDKEKLLFDYDTTLEPIVQKLFNGEDIFMDAYKLLYYPVADAGEDRIISFNSPLILDGSKSYDMNGNIVEYIWTEGDTVLCQSTEPVCEIDMLDIGTHNINLKITDNDGEIRDDNTTIVVTLNAPVAKAGADQEIVENGTTFTLDGSASYDSNGEIIEYLWSSKDITYCQGTNPVCTIENLSVADYTFILKVTDDENNSATDTMNIVYPYKPIAVAGDDINTTYGTSITLDGSNSYDSDGYIVEYKWSEGDITYCSANTPTCTIDNLDAGDHVLKLQVTDDKGTVGVDSVNVNVYREMIPKLIGTYDTNDRVYYSVLSADGNIAYLADGYGRLQILDVSNPAIPKSINRYGTYGFTSDVTLSGNETIACIANSDEGVNILDISDPSNVMLLGRYNTSSYFTKQYANNVKLSSDGNILYVSYYASYNKYELRILDISNPATPILLSSFNTASSYIKVTLSKDEQIAYIADGTNGLKIFDVSNPAIPIYLGGYNTPDWAYTVTLSADESIAYITDRSSGLQILDVSNPTTPIFLGSYNTSGYTKSLTLSLDGKIAYIADDTSGLQVLDISDPTTPVLLASYGINPRAENITISADGNTVYISAQDGGLQIVDVSSFSQ